jgi:hypothetical protein
MLPPRDANLQVGGDGNQMRYAMVYPVSSLSGRYFRATLIAPAVQECVVLAQHTGDSSPYQAVMITDDSVSNPRRPTETCFNIASTVQLR